ncbi:Brain protein 44-like protein [Zea mays]|uniref:Mitochondrial pyruvate carrier n=3 Tax=Andropogoneae TaxID=147429 RepID=A0A1D6L8C5_MAIZE|nr:Brain protein 44-like protein [Zea mays]
MYVCHHPIPIPPITLSLYSNHSAESYLTQPSSSSPGSPPAMSAAFKAFLNSPVGPKTTHFWGPVSNWGIILASVADTKKPPEMISGNMTGVLCVYSALFVRFAWMVRPRNYFLMVTHSCNECVQLYQLSRWARAQG